LNDGSQLPPDIQAAINLEGWGLAAARAYSQRVVERLHTQCRLAGLSSVEDLTAYLHEAGAVYLGQKAILTQKRSQKPDTDHKRRHKAQLQKLAKAAQQLKLQLLELEKPAADLLWRPISDPITELMSANAGQFNDQLALHRDGENLPMAFLNQEHLQQALTAIAILATDAAGALAPERGGSPDHPGLTQWVENMRAFWTGKLGQTFTVMDGLDGASPAFDFVSAALTALDPSIERKTLVSVMRKVREDALDALTPQDVHGVTPRGA
jgi:hypothetical protein